MEKEFEQLTIETLEKIKSFGVKSKTVIKFFKRSCRVLKAYLLKKGIGFSLENGQRWLSEVRPCEPMTKSQYMVYSSYRRTIFLLADQQEGKLDSWRVYPQKTSARPKTPEYLQLLNSHAEKLRIEGMAQSAIYFSMRVAGDFMIYLESCGKFEIKAVEYRDVTGYFTQESFSGRKPDGIKAYAYKLKSFLQYLEEIDVLTEKKLSLAVPKIFAKQETIVTVLSEKADRSLKNIKPETGTAVRDHAMIMLALRLGVRRSDIVKMRLSDIDWKNDKISFIQQKTGIQTILPMLTDVGNALMNYILNFRPQISDDTIFLRCYSPYQKLSPARKIPEKFLSGLDREDCPQRGFHILRRTCATTMMKNNIARSIVSASIGQIDPNSVDVYLSADEEKMRKCAISLQGIECERGDLR